jgi:hypothetical protein
MPRLAKFPVARPVARRGSLLHLSEPSGLREVEFNYDDEQDYIAKAEEVEFKFLQGGTSAYAHPIVVSVLVDGAGLVQGIRVITDDRASERDRRTAMVLSRNFKARFSDWNLSCQNLPMKDGEMKVGNQFIHELCHGTNPDGSGQRVLIEASYLRKKGQEAISRETQQVIKGAYESQTWMELVNPPYSPSEAP